MLSRAVLALAAVSLLIITLLRDDLRDLAESVQTYAAFYPYLERHPRLVYGFPSNSRAEDGDELVPPILHRIDLSRHQEDSVSKYEDAILSCQSLHPNWTHILWTEDGAAKFMSNLYPDLLRRYKDRRRSTEYANILKYALLDHYGGVYLNSDIACLQPLDELRGVPFLTPAAYPVGVSKAFMLSRPHHPFLRRLLEAEERRIFRRRPQWIEGVLNTGSMFFSNSWMRYVRSLARRGRKEVLEEERVYVLADEYGNLDTHVLGTGATSPLFDREGASSWRDWDTAVVLIAVHFRYFLAMVGLGATYMTILLWRMSGGRTSTSTWASLAKKRKELEVIEEGENLVGIKGG